MALHINIEDLLSARTVGSDRIELEPKLTAGHATSLSEIRKTMHQNASPEPVFDFDGERTWFQVILSIHATFGWLTMTIPNKPTSPNSNT